MKRSTITKSRKEIVTINQELTAIGTGAAAMEGVEQELRDAVSEDLPLLLGM